MKRAQRKLFKRGRILAIAMTLVLVTSMLGGNQSEAAKKKASKSSKKAAGKSISFKKPATKQLVVAKGKKYKLQVTASGKKAAKSITYKSSKKSVASVNKKGVVKGVKPGKAVITATSKADKKKVKLRVTVGTPVKSVALNKKTIDIAVGGQQSLKATIKPKKPSVKGVVWSTSNKKVATVSKGKVKGVKKGTATITATAADGSGKKASCRVNVGQQVEGVGIAGVKVATSRVINVSLTAPMALSQADVQVGVRTMGTQAKEVVARAVTTQDNVNYTVNLRNSVFNGEFVSITIPSLPGAKTMEAQYLRAMRGDEQIVRQRVGEVVDEDIWFDYQIGYAKYTVAGAMPEGVELDAKRPSGNYAHIKGIAKAAADRHTTVVTANDEMGRTKDKNVIFCFGDDDNIIVPKVAFNAVRGIEFETEIVYPIGGPSGNRYKFELAGTLPEGVEFNQLGYGGEATGFYFSGKTMMAGQYALTLKITAYNEPRVARDVPITLNVENGYIARGVVRDSGGSPIDGAMVQVTNLDKGNTYSVTTKVDGTYEMPLAAGAYEGSVYANPYPLLQGEDKSDREYANSSEIEEFEVANADVGVPDIVFHGEHAVKFHIGGPNAHRIEEESMSIRYSEYEDDEYPYSFLNGEFLEDGTYYFTIRAAAYSGQGHYMDSLICKKTIVVNGGRQDVILTDGDWTTGDYKVNLNLTGPDGQRVDDWTVYYGKSRYVNDDGGYSNQSSFWGDDSIVLDEGKWYLYVRTEFDGAYYYALKEVEGVGGGEQTLVVTAAEWIRGKSLPNYTVDFNLTPPVGVTGGSFYVYYDQESHYDYSDYDYSRWIQPSDSIDFDGTTVSRWHLYIRLRDNEGGEYYARKEVTGGTTINVGASDWEELLSTVAS